tara:strand:- start:15322 stop:19356 length:4035 start_codon:yes stop_codon:yes gene_type:complete
MKSRIFFFILVALWIAPSIGLAQIYEPEGINMPGSWNGFTNSNDPETMGNFRMMQRDFAGSQYINRLQVAASNGDASEGTYTMLFTSGPDGTPFQNKWTDATISIDGFSALNFNGINDNSISVENGFYYTFIFADNGYANSSLSVLKTSAVPVTINSITNLPTESVPANEPVIITVNLDTPKSPEEKIYLRYSTNEFLTSDAVEVTDFSGGTSGTATIPGQPINSSIEFYVLSTTIAKENWAGNIDLATISFENNSGSNYTYFHEANILPLNHSEDVDLTPDFTWFSINEATGYDFQLSLTDDFATPLVNETSLSDTTFSVSSSLTINTEYFWRFKSDSSSTWSDVFSFTTKSAITFANIQFPETVVLDFGNSTSAYGQLTVPGKTSGIGANNDIEVWFGVHTENSNPATWDQDSWESASFFEDKTETDEYIATFGQKLAPNNYYYSFRFQYKDQEFVFGGVNGIWDETTSVSGRLTIFDLPELISPQNGTSGLSTQPELTWSSSDSRIQGFQLQVAEDAFFTSIVLDDDTIEEPDTVYQIADGILTNDDQYFWRVRAEYDTTTSSWSQVFSFTTTQNTPGKIALTSPLDEAADVSLTPLLDWDVDDNSTSYSIQLSTVNDFSSEILSETELSETEFQLSAAQNLNAATTYFWRVQGVNETGSGEWSDTLSFTTSNLVPTLLSPNNEATDTPTSIDFLWMNISGVLSFDFQVSKSSSFNTLSIDSTAYSDTVLTVSDLEFGNSYYWRVRANYTSSTSEWSTTRVFTVIDAPPLVPELQAPDSAATNVSITPVLNWSAALGAESYQLQLSTTSGFSSAFVTDSSGILDTELLISNLNRNTTYFWRVRAFKNPGGFSDWSSSRNFTTIPEISALPTLLSPSNSSSSLPVPITFEWTQSLGANMYDFQFSDDSTFLFTADSISTDTSLVLNKFNSGANYFWRVRALNEGGATPWTSFKTFATGVGGFDGPELQAPAHESTKSNTEVLFSWKEVGGASTYQLQLSSTSDFSSIEIDSLGISGLSISLNSFLAVSTYYWRVRASDENGDTFWSESYSFRTQANLPEVPMQVSPIDSAENLTVPVTLTWNSVESALTYDIRISQQQNFSVLISNSGLTDTLFTLSGLVKNSRYYWQVRSSNGAGKSDWSTTRTFTTQIGLPGTPELVTPSDEETTPLSIRFGWNSARDAASYTIQVSNDEEFETLIVDTSSINELTYQLDQLDEGSTYFWKVRGENRAGFGAWSTTAVFTTRVFTSNEREIIPTEFALHQNYPNPFNPSTTISYDVKQAGMVRLSVYDLTGRLLHTLVNQEKTAGSYTVQFNAQHLASGIYLLRMEASGFTKNLRMTLIK